MYTLITDTTEAITSSTVKPRVASAIFAMVAPSYSLVSSSNTTSTTSLSTPFLSAIALTSARTTVTNCSPSIEIEVIVPVNRSVNNLASASISVKL